MRRASRAAAAARCGDRPSAAPASARPPAESARTTESAGPAWASAWRSKATARSARTAAGGLARTGATPARPIRAAAAGDIGSAAAVTRRSAGRPIRRAGALHRGAREVVHRLDRFNAQALQAVADGIHHHARILSRLEARRVARHIARTELQIGADAPHIGLDRQARGTGQIREVVGSCARYLQLAARCEASLGLNALTDKRGIDAIEPQAADPQAVAIPFERSSHPRGSVATLLDQACDDHAVGAPQSRDRHLRADAPVFTAGPRDLLAEDGDLAALDAFDRPHDLADRIDAVGGQHAVGLALRHHARDMPDPQRLYRSS